MQPPGSGSARSALGAVALALLLIGSADAGEWLPLAKDRIHDPRGPGIGVLQEPREALSQLTPDTAGNQVLWMNALIEGEITPRPSLRADTKVNILDLDVILKRTATMYYVRFPHRQHTEWLDCKQCHPALFEAKAGATPLNMMMILMGEKCGVCHGAVAFPLTECNRCHSVPWTNGPVGKH